MLKNTSSDLSWLSVLTVLSNYVHMPAHKYFQAFSPKASSSFCSVLVKMDFFSAVMLSCIWHCGHDTQLRTWSTHKVTYSIQRSKVFSPNLLPNLLYTYQKIPVILYSSAMALIVCHSILKSKKMYHKSSRHGRSLQ